MSLGSFPFCVRCGEPTGRGPRGERQSCGDVFCGVVCRDAYQIAGLVRALRRAARECGLGWSDVTGRSRTRELSEFRRAAALAARFQAGVTVEVIARVFGRRHETIVHLCKSRPSRYSDPDALARTAAAVGRALAASPLSADGIAAARAERARDAERRREYARRPLWSHSPWAGAARVRA